MYYTYALRGDGQDPLRPVPAAQQLRALDAVLSTVRPSALALPRSVLDQIPPRPFLYDAHRELFNRYTGITFDAISPAATAADLTLSLLLNSERAARLVEQHAVDPSLPGLDDVLDRIVSAITEAPTASPYEAEIRRSTERVLVTRLTNLAADAGMPQVRAIALYALYELRRRQPAAENEAERAHRFALSLDIQRFLERPLEPVQRAPGAPNAPPGQPIGQSDRLFLLNCDW